MDERRKSPRIRCRLPCDIERDGRHAAGTGTAVDLSEGGLCIHTDLEVEQGQSLRIALATPGERRLELAALAWHVRRVRNRSGQTFRVVGAMISEAPEAYYALVPRAAPRRARGSPSPAEPRPPAGAAPVEAPGEAGELRTFRIRVKAVVGPRTRTLSLSATSEDEARALAVEDLRGEWEVLEVVAA
jgi:hypothetical protein